jgi:hypothetical protein
MRVIITGARNWTNYAAIVTALGGYDDDTVIVAGGAHGADTLAHRVAVRMGFAVEIFKADWDKYGKRAGPDRNQRMVNAGADVCLAFPLEDSVGTWDCVRRATEAGIPVEYPAGRP